MSDIDTLLAEELELDEVALDVFVIDPEALSAIERRHISSLLEEHRALRNHVADLRAFYDELEQEDEDLPDRVEAFIDRIKSP